jgi:hypothetical protein
VGGGERTDVMAFIHIKYGDLPRPLCRKCQKPVESITDHYYLIEDTFEYVLRCHGDCQVVTQSVQDMMKHGRDLPPKEVF